MKKLYCLLASMFCLCATGFSQTAVSTMTASNAFYYEAIDPKIYNNERAKTMCEEWPGCPQWAEDRKAQDPFFLILDAEVARWLDKWEGGKAVWLTRLYIKTQETKDNLINTQAYQFAAIENEQNYTPQDPTKINKFPGHPIEGFPSQHARYHTSGIGNDSLAKCQKWDECKKLLERKKTFVGRAVESQYIYDWDENNNAIWARSLYVQVYYLRGGDAFVFRAKQKEAGGEYTFEKPQKITQCPNHSDFTF